MLFEPYFTSVRVTEWPPIGEKLFTRLTICFSWYEYLSVILVFFPDPRFMEWEFLSDCAIS